MNREEFLKQLEYLLQDVKEEEKRDAIDYYRDYLEEAGPEREEEVLRGFGSPERIASIIRTDLLGGMENGVEFTESGYQDSRFETTSLPAVRKERKQERQDTYQKGSYAKQAEVSPKKANSPWRILLIIMLVLVGSPFVIVAVLGLFSGAISIGAVLFAFLILFAALTLAGFMGGIVLIIWGISQLFWEVWSGILCIGLGMAFAGFGCLMLLCSIAFYGKFLPWLVKAIADLFNRMFRRKKNHRSKEGGEA